MEENKRLEVFVGDYIDFVLSSSIDKFKQESQKVQENETKVDESLVQFDEEETADEDERIQFFKQIRDSEYQRLMKTDEIRKDLKDKVEPTQSKYSEPTTDLIVETFRPNVTQERSVEVHKTFSGTDLGQGEHTQGTDVRPEEHTQGTDVRPEEHTQGTDVRPEEHTQGTDVRPEVHTQGTDVRPEEHTQGTDVRPEEHTQGTEVRPRDSTTIMTDSSERASTTTRTRQDHKSKPGLLRRVMQSITKVFGRKSRKVTDLRGTHVITPANLYPDIDHLEDNRNRKSKFGILTSCFGR